jgi:Arc/MetJ-type ribon-helix-helix transcriptional regulator
MSKRGFKSLTIPAGLYHELELYVEASGGYYVSVAEVVGEALRENLRQQALK